ncbi:centrosomal protein of 55 kDa [Pelodytes ibericus]
MNTKILSNKLGFKSNPSKADSELEKLKKENAALKKTVDEFSKSKGKLSDAERSRLLEKVLELETLKVKNAQEISKKNEETQQLKDALRSKLNGNVLTAEKDARQLEKLAEGVRNQIPAGICSRGAANGGAAGNTDILEGQLKDALEKNQQWLVYDQQRETYVQGLMTRIYELEQQLATVNQTLQKQAKHATNEVTQDDQQKSYDRLLLAAKKDLDDERSLTSQLKSELSLLRGKYEEKRKEAEDLSASLQTAHSSARQQREDDRGRIKEKMQRLKMELELYREKVEEEKIRSSELSKQVQVMQKSLLKHQEEQNRVSALEQQIQRCTTDFENERVDRQKVQQQLCKVLKELRKVREQRLEPMRAEYYTEPCANFRADFDEKLTLRDPYLSPKQRSPLDESFLECPKCSAVYPTSQHRELLAHLDYCTS